MRILVFAGTYEGRKLCEALDEANIATVFASTATAYGAKALAGLKHVIVRSGRMSGMDINEFVRDNSIDLIVDATHPYAQEVKLYIMNAVADTGIRYLRLLREATQSENVVEDMAAAVEYLKSTTGNVLVTTGSKELHLYTTLADFDKRLYVRVLPTPEVLARCHSLGFATDHIIAMQGPFSYEMNLAMLQAYDCRYIVSKNSGSAGGMEEKLSAAIEADVEMILIDRPVKESGLSLNEVLAALGLSHNKEFFPLFISSKGKKALVIGGGRIAERRVKTLLRFSYKVTVVAPEITDFIRSESRLSWIQAEFDISQLEGFDIVIAATNRREVNQLVARHAKVPASIADSKEESTFYFPAIVATDDLVLGLSSEGKDPALVQRIAESLRKALT